jgi:outer membrane protein TolC
VVILQLKLSEERTSQARRSFSLGRMSKFSLAEILYEFETKEFEKRKKEQEYEYVLENFISMIGVDFLTEPEMQAHDTLFRYIDGIVLHGLDKGAATSSVRLWQSRVQQAQLSARIAQGGYHPRVDIFTQANYASIGETGYRSAFEDQHKSNTSVGISLTWNLFDGFNTTATVREAFENINIAQFNLDLAAKKKRKSVASSLLAQKQVETEHSHASKYLQLLQMKYEISNEKVKLGRMNTIDLKAIEVGMSIQKIKLDQLSEKAAYYEAKLLLDGQL